MKPAAESGFEIFGSIEDIGLQGKTGDVSKNQ
jgi:hypothetical protein